MQISAILHNQNGGFFYERQFAEGVVEWLSRRRLLSLLLVLAAPLPLAAQDAGRKVTVRTLCFSHVDNVKKLYLPAAERAT